MTEREMPEEWTDSTLEEICNYIQRGKSPKYIEVSDYPVVNQKSVRWHGIIEEYLKFIHPDQWEQWSEERHLKLGDILWNSTGTGTIGRACYVSESELQKAKVVDSHVTIVRPNLNVNSRYVFYWIMSPEVQESISRLFTGTTNQVELPTSIIKRVDIPLPPLAEQKRIVAKLDEAFQHLDTLKARLERIPELLKNFRQSVLTQAVTGKLTQRGLSTLCKTVGNTEIKLPDNWRVVDFAELIETGPQNGLYKPQTAYGSGKLILRIDNFYSGRVNNWETLKRLEINDDEVGTYGLANDDIVVNRVNSIQYLGKSALIRNLEEDCVFESNVMRIKLQKSTSNPEYISLYLNSFIGLAELRKNAKHAVNQASINQQDVKSAQIILPPLEEQKEIVKRVEALFAKTDAIEGYYTSLKEKIDKLPQALLAKAFRGELVPQDANDEPTSVLLEKIKAAKASAAKPAKSKKAKGGKQAELAL